MHDFWQATERLESDSPHFLPLILSSCSTFRSVSFWHKWASATLLQCWFHASNCSLPSKAILKSPPFFGDVPRQTRGIRRKNNSRPSVWQGWEIGPPVRLQVKIKILMRKDEEPWSPARAEKCCCWEEDLGYGWTDWRREISTAVCARVYTILLLHGFCTAASQSLFAFFQTALCKLSEDPQPTTNTRRRTSGGRMFEKCLQCLVQCGEDDPPPPLPSPSNGSWEVRQSFRRGSKCSILTLSKSLFLAGCRIHA